MTTQRQIRMVAIGFTRLLWKEFFESVSRPHTAIILLVVSVFVVWTSGQLNVGQPKLHAIVLTEDQPETSIAQADEILRQFSNVVLQRASDPYQLAAEMAKPGRRLAIVQQNGRWSALYHVPTIRQEDEIIFTAGLISRSLNEGRIWLAGAAEKPVLAGRLSAAGGEPRVLLVPRTVALVVVFLPFVVAALSYAREVSFRTLPLLIAAPTGGWVSILTAKLVASAWLALMILLALLLVIWPMFGITPKAGLSAHLAVQAVAALTSAGLGLLAATVSKSQTQIYLMVATYFLCLVLLSGFLFPLETAADLVKSASNLSALTFSGRMLEHWLFFGAGVSEFYGDVQHLLAQLGVVVVLLIGASRIAAHRI